MNDSRDCLTLAYHFHFDPSFLTFSVYSHFIILLLIWDKLHFDTYWVPYVLILMLHLCIFLLDVDPSMSHPCWFHLCVDLLIEHSDGLLTFGVDLYLSLSLYYGISLILHLLETMLHPNAHEHVRSHTSNKIALASWISIP